MPWAGTDAWEEGANWCVMKCVDVNVVGRQRWLGRWVAAGWGLGALSSAVAITRRVAAICSRRCCRLLSGQAKDRPAGRPASHPANRPSKLPTYPSTHPRAQINPFTSHPLRPTPAPPATRSPTNAFSGNPPNPPNKVGQPLLCAEAASEVAARRVGALGGGSVGWGHHAQRRRAQVAGRRHGGLLGASLGWVGCLGQAMIGQGWVNCLGQAANRSAALGSAQLGKD